MKLQTHLDQLRYWQLIAMVRLHEAPIATNPRPPKARLVSQLAAFLLTPSTLQRLLRTLPPDTRRALDALLAAGGTLPWEPFCHRFGDIRDYKHWHADRQPHPERVLASPAEHLAYLGILFRTPTRPRLGDTLTVTIPTELLAQLPSINAPTPAAQFAPADPCSLAYPLTLSQDITLLLSLTHRTAPALRHGRWLSRQALQEWNQRSTQPEALENVRSEFQSQRLRFLHFLAESADLLASTAGHLAVAPQGWQWLRATPTHQLHALWAAWHRASPEQNARWQRYRLPGSEQPEPLGLLAQLLSHLARCTPGTRYGLPTFARTLFDQEPTLWALTRWWEEEAGLDHFQAFIHKLLHGPLSWLGVLYVEDATSAATDGSFILTPLGTALLRGTPLPALPAPTTSFDLSEAGTIALPHTAAPDLLLQVESLATWHKRDEQQGHYQLTPSSVARAIRLGYRGQEIAPFLQRHSTTPLSPALLAHLDEWCDQLEAIRLRRVTLLESRDAQGMNDLLRSRHLRARVRETLSPRAVIPTTPAASAPCPACSSSPRPHRAQSRPAC